MTKRWNRTETWLTLGVLGVGLLLTGLFGLEMFMSATAEKLHPEPARAPSVANGDPAQKWTSAIARARELARTRLSEENLPGLSIAVGVGGELVWAEGFGYADLENRTEVTPETRFRLGTASKVLTSAGAGLLLEQHALNLDEEIQTYVPAFPKKPWPVTLRQLMAHTAGTGSDGGDEGPYGEHCDRPVDALRIFADRDLRFEPGTQYRYGNYGWILVSAAIEKAAGQDFLTFMRERVFEPLGMHDTKADEPTKEIPNRATFYFPRYGADPKYGLHLMREIDLSCFAGSAVFLSTPSDLVRFGNAIATGTLLQRATVELLQTPQRLASGAETGYGLGWDVETVTVSGQQAVAAGHDGDVLGGPAASLWVFRERGIVVAVMSNISYADTAGLARQLASMF